MRHTQETGDYVPEIAPDLIGSMSEARDIVRSLVPAASCSEAEDIAWSLWQRAASGGWRS